MEDCVPGKIDSKNKSFAISDYDALGFDLDHTLAHSNLVNLYRHVHTCLTRYLVKEKKYSDELLEPFDKWKDFCAKGLVFDEPRGNMIKMGDDGTVLRASHGTRKMTDEEIENVYGKNRKYEHADTLSESLTNVVGTLRHFDNFFNLNETVVSARIVDVLDKENGGKPLEKYSVTQDVLDGLNEMYIPEHFAENRGGYFIDIKENPEKYYHKCSEDLKKWLQKLKESGKVVFLMTSSKMDYATLTAETTLGKDWGSYFDLKLFRARKPTFFKAYNAFKPEGNCESIVDAPDGACFSEGCFMDLQKYLQKKTGKENPKVVYFGDTLRTDCHPSKVYANWETVLILEEMEAEGMADYVEAENDGLDEPESKKQKVVPREFKCPSKEEEEFLTSSFWGSMFYDDVLVKDKSEKKYMNTFTGQLIRKYSDICIPTLEYLTDFPIDHRFTVFDHNDKMSSGFHPSVPKILCS